MFRKILCSGFTVNLLSIRPFLNNDKIEQLTKTEQTADVSLTKEETGWDRMKKVFEVDEFGNISQEANSILQATFISWFAGLIGGGTVEGQKAYYQFMKYNEATTFETPLQAKRKLQDTVSVALGKGGFKWGCRLGLFALSFVGISTFLQVYRGKYGIIEYIGGGAATGFLFRFNLGPRAWVVGTGLGAILGLICGGATLGLLNLSGLSMEETRYWQYKWRESRNESYRQMIAKTVQENELPVVKLHDAEIGEAGKSLDNLDRE